MRPLRYQSIYICAGDAIKNATFVAFTKLTEESKSTKYSLDKVLVTIAPNTDRFSKYFIRYTQQ